MGVIYIREYAFWCMPIYQMADCRAYVAWSSLVAVGCVVLLSRTTLIDTQLCSTFINTTRVLIQGLTKHTNPVDRGFRRLRGTLIFSSNIKIKTAEKAI